MKNREIKFRAWSKENEEMYNWEEMNTNYKDYKKNYLKSYFEDTSVVFMQYTGLKDKNRKEIFEGDIIEYIDEGRLFDSGKYEVEFEDGMFYPVAELYHPEWPRRWGTEYTCEVIGNIYENPELIN